MREKLFVGIIFGGRSVEHEISIKSAYNIASNIDTNKFVVQLIGINKVGGWYLCKEVSDNINDGDPVALNFSDEKHEFFNLATQQKIIIDIVFPVLHGTDGEDGNIQGMLTMAKIPIVGSGVSGSANSMDKHLSKKLLKASKVPIGKFFAAQFEEKDSLAYDKIVAEVGSPFIIKPACLGSSVGVNKVSEAGELSEALTDSFKYDNQVIFEEFIAGRELECAILGNTQPVASAPGEIVISKDYNFYTYEAKYLDENAVKIVIPADVDKDIALNIQKFSLAAYKALRCDDYARVDIFLKENGEVLVNEINTIPGFTNSSMFPMLWKHAGISYKSLITKLIEVALSRSKYNQRVVTDFSITQT